MPLDLADLLRAGGRSLTPKPWWPVSTPLHLAPLGLVEAEGPALRRARWRRRQLRALAHILRHLFTGGSR